MNKIYIIIISLVSSFSSLAIVGGHTLSSSDELNHSNYAIVFENQKIVCSGSFFSKREFITAAHCLLWISDLKAIRLSDTDFKSEEEYLYQAKVEIQLLIDKLKRKYLLLKTKGTNKGLFKSKKYGIDLRTAEVKFSKNYMSYLAYQTAAFNSSKLVNMPSPQKLQNLREYDVTYIKFNKDQCDDYTVLMSQEELEIELSNIESGNSQIVSLGYGVSRLGSKNRNDSQTGMLKMLNLKLYSHDPHSLNVSGEKSDEGLCYSDSGGPVYLIKPNGEKFQVAINRSIAAGGCGKLNDEANSFLFKVNSSLLKLF